jgi:SAM-dependent methyltransferase
MISSLFRRFSGNARAKRAELFRRTFTLDETTKILDIGSETGANINAVLRGTKVRPENVYIADIQPRLIDMGATCYGYVPVHVKEAGPLPFPDQYFDIVYCSSVIEHVTLPKERVWGEWSGSRFRAAALVRQTEFAQEIRRLGKRFFVQTPYRHFPIEPHSWLPFAAWLPRWALIPVLGAANYAWVTRPVPDWYLLDRGEMAALFGDAKILEEKAFGLIKSIMAVKT